MVELKGSLRLAGKWREKTGSGRQPILALVEGKDKIRLVVAKAKMGDK